MLELKNINKTYLAGELKQEALKDVSITFRKSEFVSILGQSGSGKTTLLNLIGGLDQYTDGDLVINGRSTKEYRDSDWDAYRNHSVGFVFQSYNLIEHQSVLANVELALTLSGVSKTESRKRACEALERVGLRGQMTKKPNQMSGGQMQRVAIARALVNNPDILLADEPTGALDSETSVQVLDILKEVARDRLVIMVTHNPELAARYSTRIIRLLDGRVVDDSAPYEQSDEADRSDAKSVKTGEGKRPSMSFFTALSLSLNNLMTKKARTILTSFAGSIGIIGIALVLSVSTGFQAYVDRVQEDTLSSYPITLEAESVDMTSLLKSLTANGKSAAEADHSLDAVYENAVMFELMNTMNSADVNVNNLTRFKAFLESGGELDKYLSAVQYVYDTGFEVYTKDTGGRVVKSDSSSLFKAGNARLAQSSQSYNVWEEMLSDGDALISGTVKEQYEVIAGQWPQSLNEIVLIVDGNNEINDLVLYALGLKTSEEMAETMRAAAEGEHIAAGDGKSWSYEEILGMTFKLIPKNEYYRKNSGGYTNLTESETGLDYLYGSEEVGIPLRISGIIRGSKTAAAAMLSGSIGYTRALSDYALQRLDSSEIIKAQLDDPATDVISGLPFASEEGDDMSVSEKKDRFIKYSSSLSVSEKAELYTSVASSATDEYLDSAVSAVLASYDRAALENMLVSSYAETTGMTDTSSVAAYISAMSDEELYAAASEGIRQKTAEEYTARMKQTLSALSADELCALYDAMTITEERYVELYDDYMPKELSSPTYEENLSLLGYAEADKPSAIKLYAASFENKDEISRIIDEYNEGADEADKITYTDYVALLMSSVTTIINAITYVLIAFVAISLVVSSIMIGIITYISVLERTKEIGLLRAVGASKRDVSRVFNAETIIVGFTAGAIGIAISALALIPINMLLHYLTKLENLSAILPIGGAAILIAVSVLLTFIAGLIPSGIAAKKNPVEALRTE